jgi:hypothetical protein
MCNTPKCIQINIDKLCNIGDNIIMKNLFLLILLVGFLFISCKLNKSIHLYSIEPFEYSENNVTFLIPERQNLWIGFQAPSVRNYTPSAFFWIGLRTNQNIENVFLKSISLNIKELNLNFYKDLLIPMPIKENQSNNDNYIYYSIISENLFTTVELLNKYNPNITLNQFYSKFNKVKQVEYHTIITYSIDNKNYETKIIWKYNSQKRTTLTWFDDIMSI